MTIAHADNAFLPESVALEYELRHLYGVNIMPKEWALDHKSAMLKRSRGDASWSLHQMAMLFARVRDHMIGFALIVSPASFAFSMLAAFLFGPDTLEVRIGLPILILFLSFFFMVVSIFMIDGFLVTPRFKMLGNYWQRTDLKENDYQDMPKRLQRQIEKASRREGVRIKVERFGQDPLVLAESGPFWKRSEVYLGGWGTGNQKIENF